MIRNLEEIAGNVLGSKSDVKGYTINGNNIIVKFDSNSHKTTWEGYIDFNDDGTFSSSNFMGSPKTGIYGNEIAELLEVE